MFSTRITSGMNMKFIFRRNSPTRARAASFVTFLYHIQWHTTVGRIFLDEWSARRRDLYLTTQHSKEMDIHAPGGIWTCYSSTRSAADRIRIPPEAWMSVCCECCVLSGKCLCDWPIPRPEESYRLCCVVVCGLETWAVRWPVVFALTFRPCFLVGGYQEVGKRCSFHFQGINDWRVTGMFLVIVSTSLPDYTVSWPLFFPTATHNAVL